MEILLDTHAALFAWIEPENLSTRARDLLEDKANRILFSQVSLLEIAIKHRIGKLSLPETPAVYVASRVQWSGYDYLPLDDADIAAMADLPAPHRDPFDWLLIATARRHRLPVMSRDAVFKEYPVQVVW